MQTFKTLIYAVSESERYGVQRYRKNEINKVSKYVQNCVCTKICTVLCCCTKDCTTTKKPRTKVDPVYDIFFPLWADTCTTN